ncbi:DNA helicase RecQ [Maricaulis maris]|uniref:DNA helicase RecQ n=1 Tax=Maricaulis maris TaxID=74318 RepID=A0A495DKD0_9PROT|nr:DNA helicase RecQ [Maricaulis maris]RKR03069.1 ATP-dependent DNA helicase RecQ [Maricaulis maris]
MTQPSPDAVLRATFGFPGFRPGQADIVDHILAGRPTLCVMPTGAGKSICYQVPALILDGLTVVISPLTALMDDQVAALQANGVAAAAIHSGRDRGANVEDWRRVQSGEIRLLYLSPERLMTGRMLAALDTVGPAMFVVDEAHCISKWGASFRPEYEDLCHLRERFPTARLAAFTATADEATRADIAAKLFGAGGEIVVHGFDRPNLTLSVAPKSGWKAQLLDFLDGRRGVSGIVYCLSRKSTEEVATLLRAEGYHALPYHAGLAPEVRRENQERFMAEEAVVMVATIAFGMGIDKPDIRYVFHLHMPGSMEAYYQEIGRAGRDGQPAEAMMLYGLSDARMRRQFIDQDGEDDGHRRREHKRLDSLLAYCEATRCRRLSLLAYFGETGGKPCGNCDLCLDPPTLIDGTREAQMLFSAIVRTGESFGTAHVIDVLRGADTEKIRARGHDNLPTHGVGAERPKPFWQGLVRQCVASGLLEIDIQGYGALKLTSDARAVLKGEQTVAIREITAKASSSKRPKKMIEAAAANVDADVLAALKALRRELAAERNVPAYVVFSDATLIDMAHLQPRSLDEMAAVNGVGPKKLETFGERFLGVLRALG